MTRAMSIVTTGLALALFVALPCSAVAGTPGKWTRVSDDDGSISGYIGLQRTGNGVLHAVWARHAPGSSNTLDIQHRPIAPNGTVGSPSTVAAYPGADDPDIAAGPGGGLLALWGGIKGGADSGFATSDDSGAAWTESPSAPVSSGSLAASPVSLENGSDGTVFESWYGTAGTFVHRGTDSATPNYDYQAQLGGYAASAPNLARDGADGSMWLGWPVFSAGANNGAWAARVDPATGAQIGTPAKMPRSSTNYQGSEEGTDNLSRWAITGRPGRPGVFMAAATGYPTANQIILWRVGSPSSITLATTTAQHRQVAITADPDGRIIVVWGTDSDTGQLTARVSNTDVTAFGPAFNIPILPGSTSLWGIAASAQSGALLDVVANFTEADQQTERFWHTQALAPPVLGKAVNVVAVSGTVFVIPPGSHSAVLLTHASQIPVGATIDAVNGRVRIVEALPGGKTASSDFYQGMFVVGQARNGLATMALAGGNFKVCGKGASVARAAKSTVVRHLWAAGKGKFRTKGRFAAATIRGTTWDTVDRCDGTLVKVTKGAVTVRDVRLKRNVVVKAGHSYFAKKR